ncbi:hypothetical protein HETIRDRAFT_454935 [Heterobasidion irregulare TC 32-1]|uniref:Uncharacterized protein n=1 Tax=Heterobasidion irregulare (strain TC 32-1) TaxID=747525 RepID=W4JS08_HETIT|nr:uncharacterized protein HETIRDRAFT_454935 [Heterobasidion irregulare TC 32-1]ETW76337.1 hypothetical protein HETIRDRAFT_454935 [Heterobasidion irregulare TC 32-1]
MSTPGSSVADELPRLKATVSLDFDEGINAEDLSTIIKSLDFINVACRHQTRSNIVLIDHIFRLASQNKVKVGACPSLSNDQMQGISPGSIFCTPERLKAFFNFLIGALHGISLEHKHPLSHIKSQGAIYVETARNPKLADAAVSAVPLFSPIATFVGLPSTEHQRATQTAQVTFLPEWHVDLKYDKDGIPIILNEQGSVTDEEVKQRVNDLLNSRLISVDPEVKLPDDVTEVSINVNSSTPEAIRIVRMVRELVETWNSGSGNDARDV